MILEVRKWCNKFGKIIGADLWSDRVKDKI